VYVIDDDRDIRLSLAFQLRTMDYDVHPFIGASDFIEQCHELAPGCLLLDVRMPEMDGGQALIEMRARGIDWPVIVMTGHAEVSMAVTFMKDGAFDFLEKPFEDAQLQVALVRGHERLAADRLRNEATRHAADRLGRLSAREKDVLRYMLSGETNKVIAFRLDLSVRTVEMHRANVLAKLGARNIAEAAVLVGGRLP